MVKHLLHIPFISNTQNNHAKFMVAIKGGREAGKHTLKTVKIR